MPALAQTSPSSNVDTLRVPPHSLEAEQAVLGGLMLAPKAWDKVADRIREDDFYRKDNRLIFRAIAELAARNQPFDAITLGEWFDHHELTDEIGGTATLIDLANNTPSAANIAAYADIVRDRAVLRQLIDAGTEIAGNGYRTEGRTTQEILEDAEQRVFQIAEAGARGRAGFVDMRNAAREAMRILHERYENRGQLTGLSTGFADLDEKTAGLQNSDLVILAGRPSMGKCLAHDTELVTEDGAVVTIEALFQRKQARLQTLDAEFRLRQTQPSAYVDDGIKPVFEVTTRLGRRVESTLPHPYLTPTGWRRLDQLKPGDHVAVPRALPVFGTQTMRNCEIRLLAYLIGDGGLTGNAPRFTSANPEIAKDFMNAVQEFGGVRARRSDRRVASAPSWRVSADPSHLNSQRKLVAADMVLALAGSDRSQCAIAVEVGVSPSSVSHWRHGRSVPSAQNLQRLAQVLQVEDASSVTDKAMGARPNQPNALTRWLAELGLMGADAHHKQVPNAVFKLRRESLALFLNRLFATDGWATVLASGQAQLGYASVSEKLARQVQHLLLRFGVVAKLRQRWVKYKDARRCSWQLDITDARSIRTFVEEIGIFGKRAATGRVLEALAQRRYQSNVDHVPAEVWALIEKAKGEMSWAELARRSGTNPSNCHVGKRALSRDRLARIAMVLGDRQLTALAHSDVVWDKITSIVPAGNKQVYDLTIPETHNFIANDICVHNTALAVNIAEAAVLRGKKTVGIFSMEMSSSQLMFRLVSSLGRINQQALRSGDLAEEDWPRVTSAITMLSESKLYIDDTPALSPVELRSRARRLHRDSDDGLGLIVIDYLQLMQVPGSKENRATEISEISRSLKALAKELNVPVVCLSQLNRALEQRNDKRPMMSDLRESGAIEQDADLIMFIYRDEYYHEDSADKGLAEIIIGKQRNGPTGTIKLAFHGQYTKFESYTPEAYEGAFE